MSFYERHKIYRFNPCDRDALPWLKRIGTALMPLASACQCCSAYRSVALIAGAVIAPDVTVVILTLVIFGLLVKEFVSPQDPEKM